MTGPNTRPPLITDHWFREGPVQPDGSDGYWICGYQGCGQHRGDHLQAEGDWLKPLHPVVPMRIRPSHCKACGRHHRHTTHVPWRWEQLTPSAPETQKEATT
ncbi:hypothetical protein [Streptomyces sp. NPDC058985]|uniref:hypothetical protein n=1 Tax=Streptomyces sp. NPDC058985 TaxID=3346684 RepID=UPI00369E2363